MSIFGIERSQTSTENAYDHAIILVDATKAKQTSPRHSEDSSALDPVLLEGGVPPDRVSTKAGTLRQQLAQRKYAKYQENRSGDNVPITEPRGPGGTDAIEESRPSLEFERRGRKTDKLPFRNGRKSKDRTKHTDSFIDVLYENQRGSFLCGIPLYSSNSLLNFDPSPWQTANFHDSGVNITNFQVPDPSWAWDWKTWYVDMSHDVDEEGWEYSFSFNKAYAWHGNHPWLFSFARRRRWLRRRVKIHTRQPGGETSKINQAHLLTDDYFTIHAASTSPSRDSSVDRSTMNRSSFMRGLIVEDDEEPDPNDITNVSALMATLRRARVDREKIAAINMFLNQGNDELFYLAEKMPAILADFVHQTSCRQLQTLLLQVLDETIRDRSQPEGKGKGKSEEHLDSDPKSSQAKIESLMKAIEVAGVHANDLEYWDDLRARVTGSEADHAEEAYALDATEPAEVSEGRPHAHSDDDNHVTQEDIKGIPKDAHVSEEPRIRFSKPGDDMGADSAHPMDRG